jgi:hypothetical protein
LTAPRQQQRGFVILAGASITLSAADAAAAKFISTPTTVGSINAVYTL